jgi:hypothetical protein
MKKIVSLVLFSVATLGILVSPIITQNAQAATTKVFVDVLVESASVGVKTLDDVLEKAGLSDAAVRKKIAESIANSLNALNSKKSMTAKDIEALVAYDPALVKIIGKNADKIDMSDLRKLSDGLSERAAVSRSKNAYIACSNCGDKTTRELGFNQITCKLDVNSEKLLNADMPASALEFDSSVKKMAEGMNIKSLIDDGVASVPDVNRKNLWLALRKMSSKRGVSDGEYKLGQALKKYYTLPSGEVSMVDDDIWTILNQGLSEEDLQLWTTALIAISKEDPIDPTMGRRANLVRYLEKQGAEKNLSSELTDLKAKNCWGLFRK